MLKLHLNHWTISTEPLRKNWWLADSDNSDYFSRFFTLCVLYSLLLKHKHHPPWHLCCHRTRHSPSMKPAGCAAYEHTPVFKVGSSLVCASSFMCFPTSNPRVHPPFTEQTKLVFWVRSSHRLAHKSHPGAVSWVNASVGFKHSCLWWGRGHWLNLSKLQN